MPKLYLAHGGIYEIPSIVFSYFPMNLDLLYAIPLYFGNDILPKYIHMAFGLMTSWLIFAHLKKRLNPAYGLLGALLFLSLPVIVKLSITVYVDLGLVFFSTAAVLCLIRWVENPFQTRHLVLSAIGCGLALGTKYKRTDRFVSAGADGSLFVLADHGEATKAFDAGGGLQRAFHHCRPAGFSPPGWPETWPGRATPFIRSMTAGLKP